MDKTTTAVGSLLTLVGLGLVLRGTWILHGPAAAMLAAGMLCFVVSLSLLPGDAIIGRVNL